MTVAVEVRNITRRFGTMTALDSVSLDIPEASFTVLLGPSGSGKTTLLNILGGFLEPSEGQVLIAGADVTHIPPARRPTTTVFQDYALFPHMTVGANVGFGLRMRRVERGKRDQRARDVLALVGLDQAFARKPHQLSGGQRQRVALARALVIEPKVLLLDEPLGALDLKLRRQMQDELKAIQKRVGTTFVHVTHDQEEAMALADLVVVMNAGRIEDVGRPERVYARPASRFTATFMGESTLLDGVVRDRTAGQLSVKTSLGVLRAAGEGEPGETVTLAIRPEHLRVGIAPASGINLGALTVEETTFQGAFVRASARASGGQLVHVRAAPGELPGAGQMFQAFVHPHEITVLAR